MLTGTERGAQRLVLGLLSLRYSTSCPMGSKVNGLDCSVPPHRTSIHHWWSHQKVQREPRGRITGLDLRKCGLYLPLPGSLLDRLDTIVSTPRTFEDSILIFSEWLSTRPRSSTMQSGRTDILSNSTVTPYLRESDFLVNPRPQDIDDSDLSSSTSCPSVSRTSVGECTLVSLDDRHDGSSSLLIL